MARFSASTAVYRPKFALSTRFESLLERRRSRTKEHSVVGPFRRTFGANDS